MRSGRDMQLVYHYEQFARNLGRPRPLAKLTSVNKSFLWSRTELRGSTFSSAGQATRVKLQSWINRAATTTTKGPSGAVDEIFFLFRPAQLN